MTAAPRANPARVGGTGSAADFLPPRFSLPALQRAAAGCRGCGLYACGTQTVFGEGPRSARILLVGEQPGDQEDRAGQPFVGPAGRLLDEALADAGIARGDVYLTNAVKHFKWERKERGERRIHKKPSAGEVTACRPWLDAELAVVQPDVIVCLGATAAQALLGKSFRITKDRGRPIPSPLARVVIATAHPSSVLRAPSAEERAKGRAELVKDLRVAAKAASVKRGDRRRRSRAAIKGGDRRRPLGRRSTAA